MDEERLFLKIYSDVTEIWKADKLSREYIYHYVLNNRTCGKKRVDEYTRNNIINRIYKIEGSIMAGMKNVPDGKIDNITTEIKDLGRIIYSFILSEECRKELFKRDNLGKHLIIENMDNLIPLELTFDGTNFLSLVYSIGRAVPAYNPTHQIDPDNIRICILSDPTGELDKAKLEGKAIAQFMSSLGSQRGKNVQVEYYEGDEVTKERVLFDILFKPGCDILHFCGHCVFDNESPSESSLLLSDGPLRAYELEEMKANPIVFSNACSTAMDAESESFFGRGLIEGLASNFVRYGAVAYIGTLWPVTDDAAMMIASKFYENLTEKALSIGESLRIAREDANRESSTSSLSALSYILFGDPSFNLYSVGKEDLGRTTFWNEKAIYEIMRLEKEYCGLEMLTVNEHHWMFWNRNTLEKWINRITQVEKEREKLFMAFDDYQRHFRKLALDGKKCFKIILNLKTFRKYIMAIDKSEARALIIDTLAFLELPNFHLHFYEGSEEEIEEYEIVSKNMDEHVDIRDNICVVIKQSRIDRENLYYFLYFNDTVELIQDHIAKYNNYRFLCLKQYRSSYGEIYAYLKEKNTEDYDEIEIKKVTKYILEQLLKTKEGI